ncbi:hypothetical protein [Rheinheimera faecalis]|uniref:hypothetical protein n=1 Tax=Rheinheimera faecalis TaxID=2901141 RepID=UPI001E29D2EE|nr:hypothetical protein [Rheinheimera faecalis]
MTNIYTASYIDFNWWLGGIIIGVWIACLIPGARNVFVHKRRFFLGDRYGALFCLTLPISVVLFSLSNKGYFANRVLNEQRTTYVGHVEINYTRPGVESVNLNKKELLRYKYESTHFPTHCWQGRFQDELAKNPDARFRAEVAWIGGNDSNEKDGTENEFPCILKLDVLIAR